MLQSIDDWLPLSTKLVHMTSLSSTYFPDLTGQLLKSLIFSQQLLACIQKLLHRPPVTILGYETLQEAQSTQAKKISVIFTVPGDLVMVSLLLRLPLFRLLA